MHRSNWFELFTFYVSSLCRNWLWWEFNNEFIYLYFYNVIKNYMWLMIILDNHISMITKLTYICGCLFYDITCIHLRYENILLIHFMRICSILYSLLTIYKHSINSNVNLTISYLIFVVIHKCVHLLM